MWLIASALTLVPVVNLWLEVAPTRYWIARTLNYLLLSQEVVMQLIMQFRLLTQSFENIALIELLFRVSLIQVHQTGVFGTHLVGYYLCQVP